MATDPAIGPRIAPHAGPAPHLFLLLCVALVAGIAAWAYLGRLDVVSDATGEVIPSSQVKSVQHLEGGIVREFLVREGQRVARGQPLLSLEATRSGADVEELSVRTTTLRIDVARLEAEARGVVAPGFVAKLVHHHPDRVARARALFEIRRNHLKSRLAGQRQLVAQRRLEMDEISTRIKNQRANLALIEKQVAISKALLKDKLTTQLPHLGLLREAASLRGAIAENKAKLPRIDAAREEASLKLTTIRDAYLQEVHEELAGKRRSLNELTNRIQKFEDSLKRTVLRSPVDGVVKTLHVVTVGGVVRPGATVVEVVPADDQLVIEAFLPTREIGFIRMGQVATIRLASGDAIRFGGLKGQVTRISPDAVQTPDGGAFFKVRITPERPYFERHDERYALVPGLQVTCSIRTGERSVVDYLLDPFLGAAGTAWRER